MLNGKVIYGEDFEPQADMRGEQALNEVSNANPKEKGRWVEKACFEYYGVESAEYECNKCAFLYVAPINAAKYVYCPNCGAKMESKEE